ncbi:MAG: hypothetical protein H7Y59_13175 [Anaerolineales bacterium]|nr:hypothetical protein [Anaerolineales bacterium]
MQTRWLFHITYLYLTIPFIIFCVGWLRLPIAIPVVAIIFYVLWQLLKQYFYNQSFTIYYSRTTFYFLLFTGLWVFISGVGGYAFQNWDHHWRNAVLRDLITYDWPVIYSAPERGPIKMLVYYVGYWLPSALVGKAFGFGAANFFLFLWTWLGVFLTALHLRLKLKASLNKIALLLILFSGMDAIGTLFLEGDYPTLWPPIQHLEIWAGNLQYSSFTTQLFWVFNQAVPAWLCCILIMESNSLLFEIQEQAPALHTQIFRKIFIWSLCFFFAPLASIGLLPYLLIQFFKGRDIKSLFKNIRLDILLASVVIVISSYLYFSSNAAAQERGLQTIAMNEFFAFFLLEGGILWLVLAPSKWRDARWVITGLLLLMIPFIQIGTGRDFVMRASIAPLFYLMIMTGEVIFQTTTTRTLRFTLYVLLLLGALTPLYEINRSIYRTYEYYFILHESQRADTPTEPATHLEQAGALEKEHPGSLVADDIVSLEFMDDQLSRNFIANVRQSLYYQYLAPR